MPYFNIATPTITLNGTSREALTEQYQDAATAIQAAIDAMAGIVHGRDYQAAPEGTYTRAREEHMARLHKLHEIQAELVFLAEHCASC